MMRKETCARWSYRTMKVSMHGWSYLSTQRREVSGVMSETFISQCHQCTAHRWWWQFFQFRRTYSPTMTWLYSPTTHLIQQQKHTNLCTYVRMYTNTITGHMTVMWLTFGNMLNLLCTSCLSMLPWYQGWSKRRFCRAHRTEDSEEFVCGVCVRTHRTCFVEPFL